jgi:hypothetical protein
MNCLLETNVYAESGKARTVVHPATWNLPGVHDLVSANAIPPPALSPNTSIRLSSACIPIIHDIYL